MKKIIISSFAVISLFVVSLVFVNHWPRGQFKDLTWLWLNESSIDEILLTLDKTPYSRVWLLNGRIQDASIRNDDGKLQSVNDPELSEFLAITKEIKLMNTWFFKDDFGWSIDSGYADTWQFLHYTSQDEMNVQVNYSYHLKLNPNLKPCSLEYIEKNEFGRCYKDNFSRWITVKTWFTTNVSAVIKSNG